MRVQLYSVASVTLALFHGQRDGLRLITSVIRPIQMRFPLFILVLASLLSQYGYAQPSPALIPSPTSVEGARFGTSMVEYRENNSGVRLAVGAPFGIPMENAVEQPGQVYIYSGNPSTVAPLDSLQAPSPTPGDLFGFSLGAEYPLGQENILAVGAPGANSAYVYDGLRRRRFDLAPPNQGGDQFGYAVDANHGFMVGGDPMDGGGAVYVWTTNHFDTGESTRLTPTEPIDQAFGSAVTITSWFQGATRLVVGAPGADESGSAYVYFFVEEDNLGAGKWVEEARLTGPSEFGKSVNLLANGETLVVTARDALYFFGRDQGEWVLVDSLTASEDGSWFGHSSASRSSSLSPPPPTGGQWDVFWTGVASDSEVAQPLSACRNCRRTSDPDIRMEIRALPEAATQAFGGSVAWNPYEHNGILVGDPLAGGTGALFAYGDAVIVSLEAEPEQDALDQIEVWPNPASGRVHIRYRANGLESTVVSLFDVLGREVTSVIPSAGFEGDRSISLDVSGLSTGSYFVVLRTASRSVTRAVTVVH